MKSLEVLGVCRPARTVSGDFYDYVELPRCRLALAFGDVSGKGISAALVMATLHSIVRTQLSVLAQSNGELRFSTAEMVSRVNDQLYTGTSPEKFATLFFGAYDESESALSYSNAGHLPPVIRRREGSPARLSVGGVVMGRIPHRSYAQAEVRLEPGDVLLLFTDGVTEAMNGAEEEFGEARIAACACASPLAGPAELQRRILAEVAAHCGSRFRDDATLAVLEVA